MLVTMCETKEGGAGEGAGRTAGEGCACAWPGAGTGATAADEDGASTAMPVDASYADSVRSGSAGTEAAAAAAADAGDATGAGAVTAPVEGTVPSAASVVGTSLAPPSSVGVDILQSPPPPPRYTLAPHTFALVAAACTCVRACVRVRACLRACVCYKSEKRKTRTARGAPIVVFFLPDFCRFCRAARRGDGGGLLATTSLLGEICHNAFNSPSALSTHRAQHIAFRDRRHAFLQLANSAGSDVSTARARRNSVVATIMLALAQCHTLPGTCVRQRTMATATCLENVRTWL
jgi:hypothetical protein